MLRKASLIMTLILGIGLFFSPISFSYAKDKSEEQKVKAHLKYDESYFTDHSKEDSSEKGMENETGKESTLTDKNKVDKDKKEKIDEVADESPFKSHKDDKDNQSKGTLSFITNNLLGITLSSLVVIGTFVYFLVFTKRKNDKEL